MPYKDPERRRQAARKWRIAHREQRAAYMRRYRRARSSGRPPGRPRSHDTRANHHPVATEWGESGPTTFVTPPAGPVQALSATTSSNGGHGKAPPSTPPRDHEEFPPSPSAAFLEGEEPFTLGRV